MKDEARLFDIVMVFAFFTAVVYGVMTGVMTDDGVEPVGTVSLILTGGLTLMVGSYIRFIGRRIPARPEDNDEAEVSDGAGELGFFSAGSYWPVGLAAFCALAGAAMAFWQVWLLVFAVIGILITIGGLVFEYHTGPNAH
ncbi:cytochrome C oxidase subunit IV [Saccharomonospora sp. CUA-673]|uniref:cytochrome c oxidase subunit 4 n=1 Tax=Saccharomonospora sp. CUA-673 TaxID=1904969 RepID=UPI00095E5373|nr:cytochrome c oxidase subunit 4 [Saccharomonospora sp. CUA-673]OLT46982.1 cytochrome C oxidase subunit IV [Saccharomonospora sp. CUA-673]